MEEENKRLRKKENEKLTEYFSKNIRKRHEHIVHIKNVHAFEFIVFDVHYLNIISRASFNCDYL